MTLLRYLLLRMLLASAMGGVSWGSLAAIGATTQNPIADQGRRLLEQAAAAAPALALDALKALPEAAADAITQAGGHFGDAVRGLAGGGPADEPGRTHARVVRVADGDTITVRREVGEKVKVRLLGIDAPESTTLRRGHAECGGQEAKALMQRLAAQHPRVTLVSDPTQDAVDRYGRQLAYVVPTGGGPSFQERVLEAGWAQVYVFRESSPPARTSRFRAAAAQARGERRGVWQACGGSFTQPR